VPEIEIAGYVKRGGPLRGVIPCWQFTPEEKKICVGKLNLAFGHAIKNESWGGGLGTPDFTNV